MIDIRRWFNKTAIYPIGIASFLAAILWFAIITWQIHSQEADRTRSLDQIEAAVSIGIGQNNRVLLETILQAAEPALGAEAAILCLGNKKLLSVSSRQFECAFRESDTHLAIVRPIQGFQNYELHILRQKYLELFLPAILFGIAALLFVTIYFFFRRVTRLIDLELFRPLESGLLHSMPLEIEELNKLQNRIKEANDQKINLAVANALLDKSTQVAHDIKSPLSALQMLTARKSETRTSAEDQLLDHATRRIAAIVADLDTQRTSQLSSPSGLKDVFTFVREIVEEKNLEHGLLGNKQIKIEFEGTQQTFFEAEPTEIQRVLSNLINNAVDAHENDDPQIVVKVKCKTEKVEFEISDQGKGIPDSVMPRLGTKGFTHAKTSGNGLGLFHAKLTAAKHRGHFEIRNNPLRGATARFELPTATNH